MSTQQHVFKAIADPTRREIINMLALEDLSVGEVASHFEMTRPAVSKHLGILKKAELIRVEKRGRVRVNRLTPEALKTVADWLAYYSRFWDEKLASLKDAVENHND